MLESILVFHFALELYSRIREFAEQGRDIDDNSFENEFVGNIKNQSNEYNDSNEESIDDIQHRQKSILGQMEVNLKR